MSSAWGKIEKVNEINFDEIMSEEIAREIQKKEIEKIGGDFLQIDKCIKIFDEKSFADLTEKQNIEAGAISETAAHEQNIPDEVLRALSGNDEIDLIKSDSVIAQLLQSQFDLEYDEEINRLEKAKNKDSKVSISLSKYRMLPEELMYDSDPEDLPDNSKKHWDRFETNEKKFAAIPKWGSIVDGEGERRTKHDADITGTRNACKVMSFPPEFNTGDGAGFEMKLSNSVFNHLKTYSQSKKTLKAHDRKENVATAEMGLDQQTRLILYKLINNQILEKVNGIISTGKEAVILHADCDALYVGELILPKECAVKIFSTTLNKYKQRDRYIKDDYRFKDRFSKQNKRTVIRMWAEKEMHNLMRLQKFGILCPSVVTIKRHVLIMSFIGDNSYAAPKLKDAHLTDVQLDIAYNDVVDIMMKLYNEARLVHADLSEYNILYYKEKCYIIDVAQSVEPDHPSALEFLMRDCANISNFFTSHGVQDVKSKEELFSMITGLDPIAHNTAMLERLHVKGPHPHIVEQNESGAYPDEFKPLIYPFDYAWEKVKESKKSKKKKKSTVNEIPIELPSSSNSTTNDLQLNFPETSVVH